MTQLAEKTEGTAIGPARRRRTRGAIIVGVLGLAFLLVGMNGAQYQGKLSKVEKNDNSAFLPASAESTKVDNEVQRFQSVQTMPGFVVYHRPGGLTLVDRTAVFAEARAFRTIHGVAADQVGAPQFSSDGTTASVAVPLVAKIGNVSVQGDTMKDVERAVLKVARAGVPAGLAVHSAGPGGLLVALIDSFSGIDGALLLAALLVVILILLVVYRSPVLWIFPLLGAVVALGAASLVVYTLAAHGVLTLNGQSTGILSVLVLGAGTDYALLLTSRYREELHNFDSRIDAMTRAWRRASTAIGASGATVILGLLTLSLGELNSDRSLGPVAAIGIAATVLSMLTFLPLALTVMPRGIFWPRIPRADHAVDVATQGPWSRIAAFVGRNNRRAWVSATVVLAICAVGITTLKAGGLPMSAGFTNTPDAVVGQRIYDAHFAQGTGAPAEIITNVSAVPQVIAAVSRIPGVSSAPGSVCVEADYAKVAALRASSASADGLSAGCPAPQLSVSPHGGRLIVDAILTSSYDSQQAYDTVVRIRSAVHAIPGADALVGGQSAINYDTNQAAKHDRNLIIPVVLAVILVILMLLLRAVLAPILLVGSVVLSFAATLGMSAFFFNHVFHFVGADPSFPLFVFVFLVALGVDYNIFLMTRVREETLAVGTRRGILRGLTVTGGVITSAGVVLAATFAVLRVIPLVFLSELGFAVALGVLMDTIVVRSVLVPALSHDIGKTIWWPSRLTQRTD
jgi:putative drug exporter of the RND superfamily